MIGWSDARIAGFYFQVARSYFGKGFFPKRRGSSSIDGQDVFFVEATNHVHIEHVIDAGCIKRSRVYISFGSDQAEFFRRKSDEKVVVFFGFAGFKALSKVNQCSHPAGVVVGPIVNGRFSGVAGTKFAFAQVVEMRTDHNGRFGPIVNIAQHIAALTGFAARCMGVRIVLKIKNLNPVFVVAFWSQPDCFEAAGNVFCSEHFAFGAGFAAF